MAITRQDTRVINQPIGVTQSNGGSQQAFASISRAASIVGEIAFNADAKKAKQAGLDMASEMDRENLITLDPDTGKPVALSMPHGFGSIQEDAYNSVIFKRFQNHMRDEIISASSDIAKRANYDPEAYRLHMGEYLKSMDIAGGGEYNGFIADVGYDVISKTSANLTSKAVSRSVAAGKLAAKENVDHAMEAVNDAASIAALGPDVALDPRFDARTGASESDLGGRTDAADLDNLGSVQYRDRVSEAVIAISEEFQITGDAKKYVKNIGSLKKTAATAEYNHIEVALPSMSDSERLAVEQALENPLYANLIADPEIRARVRTIDRILDRDEMKKLSTRIGSDDKYLDALEAEIEASERRDMLNRMDSPATASQFLNDPDSSDAEKRTARDFLISRQIEVFAKLDPKDIPEAVQKYTAGLTLGGIIDGLPDEVSELLADTAGLGWSDRKKLREALSEDAVKSTLNASAIAKQERFNAEVEDVKHKLQSRSAAIKTTFDNQSGGTLSQKYRDMLKDNAIFAEDISEEIKEKLSPNELKIYEEFLQGAWEEKFDEAARKELVARVEKESGLQRARRDRVLQRLTFEIGIKLNDDGADLQAISSELKSLQQEVVEIGDGLTISAADRHSNKINNLLAKVEAEILGDKTAGMISAGASLVDSFKHLSKQPWLAFGLDSFFENASATIAKLPDGAAKNGQTRRLIDIYNTAVQNRMLDGQSVSGFIPSRFEAILEGAARSDKSLLKGMSQEEALLFKHLEEQVGRFKGEEWVSNYNTWTSQVKGTQATIFAGAEAAISADFSVRQVTSGAAVLRDEKAYESSLNRPQFGAGETIDANGAPTIKGAELQKNYLDYGILPSAIVDEMKSLMDGDISDPATKQSILRIVSDNPDIAVRYLSDEDAAALKVFAFRRMSGESLENAMDVGTYEASLSFVEKSYPDVPEGRFRDFLLKAASLYANPSKASIREYMEVTGVVRDDRVSSGTTDKEWSLLGFELSEGSTIDARPLNSGQRFAMDRDVNDALVLHSPHLATTESHYYNNNLERLDSVVSMLGDTPYGRLSEIEWSYRLQQDGTYLVVHRDEFGKDNPFVINGVRLQIDTRDYLDDTEVTNLTAKYHLRFRRQANSDPATAKKAFPVTGNVDQADFQINLGDLLDREPFENEKTQGYSDAYSLSLLLKSQQNVFHDEDARNLLTDLISNNYISPLEDRSGISDALEFYIRGGLTEQDYENDINRFGWVRR